VHPLQGIFELEIADAARGLLPNHENHEAFLEGLGKFLVLVLALKLSQAMRVGARIIDLFFAISVKLVDALLIKPGPEDYDSWLLLQ
jgi:hypothetical protein